MEENEFSWRSADAPPKGTETSGWEIKRTPTNRRSVIAIVSDRWYGVYTHHFSKRTFPCLGEKCFCVESGKEARWYGFLLAKEHKTRKHLIWEFPAGAAKTVSDALIEYNTLRGCIFEFWRRGSKDNDPVLCRVVERLTDLSSLPNQVPIIPLLARIWEYKSDRNFKQPDATQQNLELGLVDPLDDERAAGIFADEAFDGRGDLRANIPRIVTAPGDELPSECNGHLAGRRKKR